MKVSDAHLTTFQPIEVKKVLTWHQLNLETRQHGVGVSLLQGVDGEQLGHGLFPAPSVLSNLLSLCLRQIVAESTDYSLLSAYTETSNYLSDKVIENLRLGMSDDDFRVGFDKDQIKALMSSKSASFIDSLWDDHLDAMSGKEVRAYVRNRQIVKYEESSKTCGLMKVRGITIMKEEAYIYLYRFLQIQKKVYSDPFLSKWMIKGKTPHELIDQLNTIIEWTHRSQDISGFEKGILDCLRRPLENKIIYQAFLLLGLKEEAEYFLKFVGSNELPDRLGARKVSHEFFTVYLMIRCSGDFWTSLGNGLVNISIILTGHRLKFADRYTSLDSWWAEASRLNFVTEGDDALIPLYMWHDVASRLGMSYSLVSVSHKAGGSDFLKVLHYPFNGPSGVPYKQLNVLRTLRSLSYVTMTGLNKNKFMFLWRAKAMSVVCLSPGHPILYALCSRIGFLTRGARAYSGWEQDFEQRWGVDNLSSVVISSRFPDYAPTDDMRAALAGSVCLESPPITVDEQLLLEEQFATWDMWTPVTLTASLKNFQSDYVALVGSSDDMVSQPVYSFDCDPSVHYLLRGLANGFPQAPLRPKPDQLWPRRGK